MDSSREINFTCESESKRLDLYLLKKIPALSRSGIKKIVEKGLVRVNGINVKAGHRLKPADRIDVILPEPPETTLKPEALPLDIIYEDRDIIVIDKPPGMPVHPGAGRPSGTLVNALLNHTKELSSTGGPQRPGIVHRLDMDTTGVLVIAKNALSHMALAEQFKAHSTVRKYIALVRGMMRDDKGVIDMPLGRSPSDRKKISTRSRKKRRAVTNWRVMKRYPGLTLLEIMPGTGRTHQIRVHLAAINRPIIGDTVYGGRVVDFDPGVYGTVAALLKQVKRQCLHAMVLGFNHPATGEYMEFSAPLPPDMGGLIEALDERFS